MKCEIQAHLQKNNEAPDGERYCNGFCQKYKSVDEFLTINTGHNTICEVCKNMEIIAKIKIIYITLIYFKKFSKIKIFLENKKIIPLQNIKKYIKETK